MLSNVLVVLDLSNGCPTALKRATNELKKIRKKQLAEDKKVAEKMMAASAKKPVRKGLTKAERKAAEEYDAKNNTAAAQRLGEETRIAQAVEFLLQPVRLVTTKCCRKLVHQ